jgi:hypothetical protein
MKTYVLTVSGLLTACALLVAIVDPGHRYLRPVPPPTAPLAAGQARVLPADHDERVEKRAFAQLNERADLVVFGSSRGMTVRSSMLRDGTRLLNLGVSGGTLDDDLALYEVLAESDRLPTHVVVYLDPWVFNAHRAQPRWITLRNERDRFLSAHGALGTKARVASFFDWLQARGTEASELIAYPTVRASVAALARDRGLASTAAQTVPVDRVPPPQAATLADGAHIPRHDTKMPTEHEAKAAGEVYANAPQVYSLSPWEEDTEAVKYLDVWLAALKAKGIEPLLVLPPYQPTAYALLTASPTYGPILQRYRALATGTKAPVCDRIDPAAAGCAPNDFWDGMHTTERCQAKVVAGCLAETPAFAKFAPVDR